MGVKNPHELPSVGSLSFKRQVSPLRLAVFTNHDSLKALIGLLVEVCSLHRFAVFPKGCTQFTGTVDWLIRILKQGIDPAREKRRNFGDAKEAKLTYQSAEEQHNQRRVPVCPLCGWRRFRKEEGRLDSKWGFTSHKMILLICEQCHFVLHFYDGHSIFDFD